MENSTIQTLCRWHGAVFLRAHHNCLTALSVSSEGKVGRYRRPHTSLISLFNDTSSLLYTLTTVWVCEARYSLPASVKGTGWALPWAGRHAHRWAMPTDHTQNGTCVAQYPSEPGIRPKQVYIRSVNIAGVHQKHEYHLHLPNTLAEDYIYSIQFTLNGKRCGLPIFNTLYDTIALVWCLAQA